MIRNILFISIGILLSIPFFSFILIYSNFNWSFYIACSCMFISLFILAQYSHNRKNKKIIVYAKYDKSNQVMTVRYNDGTVKQFEGDCTVWCELPYMTDCDTDQDELLYSLWKYNKKWNGAYPDAHLKQKL